MGVIIASGNDHEDARKKAAEALKNIIISEN